MKTKISLLHNFEKNYALHVVDLISNETRIFKWSLQRNTFVKPPQREKTGKVLHDIHDATCNGK